jgi:hypothetical protein
MDGTTKSPICRSSRSITCSHSHEPYYVIERSEITERKWASKIFFALEVTYGSVPNSTQDNYQYCPENFTAEISGAKLYGSLRQARDIIGRL